MFKALIQRLRKDQRGLTLIELLVVIVILGIIAAIAVPMILANTEDANINTNKQNAVIITDAAQRFMVNNPSHTGTIAEEALTGTGSKGPYLNSFPKPVGCTAANTSFTVAYDTTSKRVTVTAAGCPGM